MVRNGNRGVKADLYYINAPAGTGKTHSIINRIIEITQKEPLTNILAITFTNRAADELKMRIAEQVVIGDQVKIGTIHSFLHEYFKQYFVLPQSLELYFEIYEKKILDEIKNNCDKDVNDDRNRNARYLEKNGMDKSELLTLDIVREHLSRIEYSESQYSDYYNGLLSHDDLVFFTSRLVEEHPILQKNIGEKYGYIFIDECQDTSSDILRMFNSVGTHEDSKVNLYFFGDKMQEIYDNYDGTFEDEFGEMDHSIKLSTNYRSSEEIVDALANLYGDLTQEHKAERGKFGLKPTIYLADNVESKAAEFSKDNDGFLALRIFNRDRFNRHDKSDDMSVLFAAYNDLIPYGSKESLIDVLIPAEKNLSPDFLLNFLWQINNIIENFESKQYGQIIQQIKNNPRLFNFSKLNVDYHEDKKTLELVLNQVAKFYRTNKLDYSIGEFIFKLEELEFCRTGLFNDLEAYELYNQTAYEQVLSVPLMQFVNLVRYNKQPDISTQHGVKGEGHNKILLVLEDSTSYAPFLLMYDFLEMFVLFDDFVKDNHSIKEKETVFNLYDFQEFKYKFNMAVNKLEIKINKKIREITKQDIKGNLDSIHEIINAYIEDPYYKWIYGERIARKRGKANEINEYLELLKNNVPKVSNIKQLLKYADTNRILTAYKLFYVGCSRAKNELILIIDKTKIENFKDAFIAKFEEIGFVIN